MVQNGDLSQSFSSRLKHWGQKIREKLLLVSFGITLLPPARATQLFNIAPKILVSGLALFALRLQGKMEKGILSMTFFLPFVFGHRVINPLGLAVFSGDRGVVKSFPKSFLCIRKGAGG